MENLKNILLLLRESLSTDDCVLIRDDGNVPKYITSTGINEEELNREIPKKNIDDITAIFPGKKSHTEKIETEAGKDFFLILAGLDITKTSEIQKKLLKSSIEMITSQLQAECGGNLSQITSKISDPVLLFNKLTGRILVNSLFTSIIEERYHMQPGEIIISEFGEERKLADFLEESADKGEGTVELSLPQSGEKFRVTIEELNPGLFLFTLHDKLKIQEAEAKLIEAMANIDSVLYSVNGDGSKYHFVTDSVKKIFGYSPEEFYSDRYTILRRIEKDDLPLFRNFLKEIQEGNEAVAEYKIRNKHGDKRIIRHSANPVAQNGSIHRIVGVITDITKERELYKKLEKSEKNLRDLFENAGDLIFYLDSQYKIIMINQTGAEQLEYPAEELSGLPIEELIEPGVRTRFKKFISSGKIPGKIETLILGNDKKPRNFEIQLKPVDPKFGLKGILGVGRDITVRVKTRKKLVEINKKLQLERNKVKDQISLLEEIDQLKNEFIENISHEIRTPLASIVGFAETIDSDRNLTYELIYEFNKIILEEGRRLNKKLEELMDFSKFRDNDKILFRKEFDLTFTLWESIKKIQVLLKRKNIDLRTEIADISLIIRGKAERWNQPFYPA